MKLLILSLLGACLLPGDTITITVNQAVTNQTFRYWMYDQSLTPQLGNIAGGAIGSDPSVDPFWATWATNYNTQLTGQNGSGFGVNTIQFTVSNGQIELPFSPDGAHDPWTYFNILNNNPGSASSGICGTTSLGWAPCAYASVNDNDNAALSACPDPTYANCKGSVAAGWTASYSGSLTIGTGTNYINGITIATGLNFQANQAIEFWNALNEFMSGYVVSYNSSTGLLTATMMYSVGSGSYSTWTISQAPSFPMSGMDWNLYSYLTPQATGGGILAAISANNYTPHIQFQYIAWQPPGGTASYLYTPTATGPAEVAEEALAAFSLMYAKYGFYPEIYDAMVEPDNHCVSNVTGPDAGYCKIPGDQWSSVILGNNIAAVKTRLNAAGFYPKFWCCSVTAPEDAVHWFTSAQTQAGFNFDAITFHCYSAGCSQANTAPILAQAQSQNIPMVMDECSNNSGCSTQIGSLFNYLRWGFSGIEEYVYAPVQSTCNTGTLGCVSNDNPYAFTYTNPGTASSTAFAQQLWSYIHDGDWNESVSSDTANYTPVAFRSPNRLDKVSVLAAVGASSGHTIAVTKVSAGTYGCTYTTLSATVQTCPNLSPAGGVIGIGGTVSCCGSVTLTNPTVFTFFETANAYPSTQGSVTSGGVSF